MLIIVFKCRLCLWTTRLRVEVRDTQNREVVVLCVFMCVGCCNTYSSRSWRAAPDVAQVEMREQLPPECPSESANRPSHSPSVTDCLSRFFSHITPDRLSSSVSYLCPFGLYIFLSPTAESIFPHPHIILSTSLSLSSCPRVILDHSFLFTVSNLMCRSQTFLPKIILNPLASLLQPLPVSFPCFLSFSAFFRFLSNINCFNLFLSNGHHLFLSSPLAHSYCFALLVTDEIPCSVLVNHRRNSPGLSGFLVNLNFLCVRMKEKRH